MDKLKDDVVQIHQKVDEINSAVEVRASSLASCRFDDVLID